MPDKPSRNEDEYFVKQDAELMQKTREKLRAQQEEAERRTHFMKCPKDGYDLTSRDLHGVQVETCGHCGGMWLDAGELDVIERHQDSPGLLGRVMADVMATLRKEPRGTSNVRREPGNPLT